MAIMDVFDKVKKQRKKAEQKKALKNVAVGAALGATVGAVAGVLLAPKSGKETREDLANATKEGIEKAKVKAEEAKIKAVEVVAEVKSKVKQKMGKTDPCDCGCSEASAASNEEPEK